MSAKPSAILIDTNVWVDYYVARGPRHEASVALVDALEGGQTVPFTALTSLKDTYYLIAATLKRMARESSVEVDSSLAAAANETAWGCVRNLVSIAPNIVRMGAPEALRALSIKETDPDFEDALIIAAAERVKARYIVTADRGLATRSPIPCVDPREMADILAR